MEKEMKYIQVTDTILAGTTINAVNIHPFPVTLGDKPQIDIDLVKSDGTVFGTVTPSITDEEYNDWTDDTQFENLLLTKIGLVRA